ncbi:MULTISPECIES: biotin--[acetyl-CoA-carboxylase] ligase [Metabacillus]|jgi:BirA family transcriptional regulator, biotin operon repressor / biotin---[acetyl-CoA-carboxylase] ligase|uniref:Bifunctional ligase/repressor BirA n=1 Tax=Metabacillus rhizolycopersici TaxID=2875709 RepID=A0ABS7UTW4_9BACI|nr:MULTISPECIES: biotin--[acetyl-CoA-carboxylase] ligase [Metabacillus]MBZ5751497.1 biotin--[acetyl-CoA-carboxylase] ligase [Metabacillus rhizolycopersici]MCM3652093.1 biotin--[acetyl-CoA-carboxylase] ligase [Metabacillus litoralis]
MQTGIRAKLLEAFSKADGEFLSGQKISDYIGCSRTAVWKHMEELRKEGYELEAVRRLGYRITKKPDKISSNEIQLGLKTTMMGRHIHFEEIVSSTQKIARNLANEGVEEGTIVVADQQTNGKGRMARVWYSPKGTGIWMSMIIRPNLPVNQTPQLTLLTAVAIVQAIEELTPLKPEIKWPNDIMLNGKKLVGILTELQAEADQVHSVIIGTGINVNQKIDDFPEELQSIATSIFIETGTVWERAQFIQMILLKFEGLYSLFLTQGFKPIKLLWESYAISLNKKIIARTLSGTIVGKAIGIDDDGVLLIETNNRVIERIYSADIDFQ